MLQYDEGFLCMNFQGIATHFIQVMEKERGLRR